MPSTAAVAEPPRVLIPGDADYDRKVNELANMIRGKGVDDTKKFIDDLLVQQKYNPTQQVHAWAMFADAKTRAADEGFVSKYKWPLVGGAAFVAILGGVLLWRRK